MNQAAHLLEALTNLGLKFQIRQYQINTECDHDLCHYCVIGVANKGLNFEVLFDPFKEQLNLPALLINSGNGLG